MTLLVDTFPIWGGGLIALLVAIAAWYTKQLVSDIKYNQIEFRADIKRLNSKIDGRYKEIERLVQTNGKELYERIADVKEQVNEIDIKQEKVKVIMDRVQDIQGIVARQADTIFFMKEETINTKRDVTRIWDLLKQLDLEVTSVKERVQPAPEPNISHLLASKYLSEKEKEEIIKYKEYLLSAEPWNVEKFVFFVETKIKKNREKDKKKQDIVKLREEVKKIEKVDNSPIAEDMFKELDILEEVYSEPEDNNITQEFKVESMDHNLTWDHISRSIIDKDKGRKKKKK
jgi:hypothetical protein